MTSKKGTVAIIIVTSSLVLGGIGLFVLNMFANSDYKKKYDDNAHKISELNAELKDLRQVQNITQKQAEKNVDSAAKLGSELAELQNNYFEFSHVTTDEDFKKQVDNIDPYFAKDSKDSRVQWYSPGKDHLGYPVANCKWTFESTFGFIGDNVDVIWICRETETNDILAYTTGVFNGKEKNFTKVRTMITSKGIAIMKKSAQTETGVS